VESGPKFTGLSSSNAGGNVVDNLVVFLKYFYLFRRYSRSKWEGVSNRAKFSVFFAPNFFGGRPLSSGTSCGKVSWCYFL